MAKTEKTIELERSLYKELSKIGVFGCFEVTIGFGGNERVDFMTYDTKGIYRCYEIKVSKSDFYSKAKKSFVGNYNYYVLPHELYESVKEDVPREIGVYTDKFGYVSLVKRPKKQKLKIEGSVLKDSLIRSLSRENQKFVKSGDTDYTNRMNRAIENLRKENAMYRERNSKLVSLLYQVAKEYDIKHEAIDALLREGKLFC